MTRHPLLFVAASIAVFGALAHSYLGERYLLIRLFRRQDLPKLFGDTTFTKHTLRFAWHLTSVAWLGFAALLAELGSAPAPSSQTIARTIAVTFGVSGVVALVGSRGRHLSWFFFLAATGLIWFGLR